MPRGEPVLKRKRTGGAADVSFAVVRSQPPIEGFPDHGGAKNLATAREGTQGAGDRARVSLFLMTLRRRCL